MKCPICNGKGYQFIADYDGMYDIVCEQCKGKGEVDENGKPIFTNEEYLKSCNTEQFAEWLSNTFDLCGAGCSKCFVKELCFNEPLNKMPSDLIVEWLKQPHTKE